MTRLSDFASMITTQLVVIETVSLLTKRISSFHARQWYRRLRESAGVEVRAFSTEVFREAEKLWQSHRDKEWDLIDCYSFCVMRRESIRAALAFDDHFRQAGFQIVE
ncbi:MAG: PIN domain-containing protein [Verrucomicrobiota bacterium]|nr:PIN domain-containing protein [Verrucomicrobiota bacterium]